MLKRQKRSAVELFQITVVMYHYVREFSKSRFKGLKGSDVQQFRWQLGYLQNHYTIIGLKELFSFSGGTADLPERACLLTFDDGLSDHYDYVFPILLEARCPAVFFVIVRDGGSFPLVHMLHVLLSELGPGGVEQAFLEVATADERRQFGDLKQRFFSDPRLREQGGGVVDDVYVSCIKDVLQKEMYEVAKVRVRQMCDRLFNGDAAGVLSELYLTDGEIVEMHKAGMGIGGHGVTHAFHARQRRAEQRSEIVRVAKYLTSFSNSPFAYSYPSGSYDQYTIRCLLRHQFRAAFTVRPVVEHTDFMQIGRKDTNEFPKEEGEGCLG